MDKVDKADNKEKKEGFFSKLKKIKHIEIIIAVGAVVVMLVIYFAGFGGLGSSGSGENTENESIYSDYCAKMQGEVTDYVSKIKGAGNAKAIINWESGVELVLAAAESNSASSSTSTPTIINVSGSSQPIVIKEIYPKAIGVVVVCEGGGDASVKVSIIMSVSILLNISSDKVIVLPMEKGK